jgi:5-methylcytosine-specific restriction endonuclease McrA
VLRRSSSAWRRAELFISERNGSGSADRRREQQRHEYPFTFPIRPGTPKKQIPFFGTSDSLYNYYLEAACFGCGHQEENKWIRRSPVFWALRLH